MVQGYGRHSDINSPSRWRRPTHQPLLGATILGYLVPYEAPGSLERLSVFLGLRRPAVSCQTLYDFPCVP